MQEISLFLHKSPLFLVKRQNFDIFLHKLKITLAFPEKICYNKCQ